MAVSEGRLPHLRVVRVSHHLSWTVGRSSRKVHKLAEVLRARAAVDGERNLSGVGVWEFDGSEAARAESVEKIFTLSFSCTPTWFPVLVFRSWSFGTSLPYLASRVRG